MNVFFVASVDFYIIVAWIRVFASVDACNMATEFAAIAHSYAY